MYKTMLSYCLKCRKSIKSKKPKMAKANNGRLTILLKCVVCDSKQNQDLSKKRKQVHRQLS